MTTPERSLNHQVVLEEDEYTEALSEIIARDFFPSLIHLDATNDYLDALHSRDPHLINTSVRKLQEINSTPTPRSRGQTLSDTPYYAGGRSDTPLRTPRGELSAKRRRYDTDMSLDNFQAKYTSEDNSSFTDILDDENRKRKEKWSWAWDAQRSVQNQRDRMIESRERSLIDGPTATGIREKFRIEAPTPAGLITDGKEVDELKDKGARSEEDNVGENKKNAVMIMGSVEEGKPVDVMAPTKDTRAAGVDGWEFKVGPRPSRSYLLIIIHAPLQARNSLMFPPDANVAPYDISPLAAANRAKGDPKVIKHGNTRLPEQADSQRSEERRVGKEC